MAKRHEAWGLLKHLKKFSPQPWLCVGDFNEIVDLSEKWGVAGRSEGQKENFRQTIEDCHLSDLGLSGSKFTWSNAREDGGFTKERLDRALANLEWCEVFHEGEVQILAACSSDHKSVLVNFIRSSDDD